MKVILRKIVRRIRRYAAAEPDQRTVWTRLLGSRLEVGAGAVTGACYLTAREPEGCSLAIGAQSDVECQIALENAHAAVRIGARCHLGGGTLLAAACKITVGDDVQIAYQGLIMDHDSHALAFSQRKNDVLDWQQGRKDWSHVAMAPVTICDKAWIGARVTILKGVTVGEGAVVGAGSVVTKSVAPWTVVAGNPARVIRELSESER